MLDSEKDYPSLETNSELHLKNRPFAPKGKDHFQKERTVSKGLCWFSGVYQEKLRHECSCSVAVHNSIDVLHSCQFYLKT